MKKLILLPAVFVIFAGCAKKEDVLALQEKVTQFEHELQQMKKEQLNLKESHGLLTDRIDNLGELASKNSKEIERLKKKLH